MRACHNSDEVIKFVCGAIDAKMFVIRSLRFLSYLNLIQLVTWGVTNRDVLLLATIRYLILYPFLGNLTTYIDILTGFSGGLERMNSRMMS